MIVNNLNNVNNKTSAFFLDDFAIFLDEILWELNLDLLQVLREILEFAQSLDHNFLEGLIS